MSAKEEYLWIEDKEYGWRLAEVREYSKDTVKVALTEKSLNITLNGRNQADSDVNSFSTYDDLVGVRGDYDDIHLPNPDITIKISKTAKVDSTHFEDLDDLCGIVNYHEAPILHILRRRWMKHQIYTYVGDILISINPLQSIRGLYDIPKAFYRAPKHILFKPHVYVIAKRVLEKLKGDTNENLNKSVSHIVNQSIIISGESGAGKTETAKYLIHYLVNVNEFETKGQSYEIKRSILDSNMVLESFGNASTTQNHNSSRFGKYIKLNYTEENELISATTEIFLLEKSRLVNCRKDEKSYHIFYQLIYGLEVMSNELKTTLQLTTVSDYVLLNNDTNEESESIINNHARSFSKLFDALLDIGCSEQKLKDLWSLLAIILHLSNITFIKDSNQDRYSMNCSSTTISFISSILGVDEKEFIHAVTTHLIHTKSRSSIKIKLLNEKECFNNLQALMKKLYSSIFSWILKVSNDQLSSYIRENKEPVKHIGILDIFGFEVLQTNSYEQFCINFISERLQQQFNDRIFASEQELYVKESINWTTIIYQDNQNVIDLISKKPTGILYILEELSMMNRSPDDMALLRQMNQTHGDRSDRIYLKSRFGTDPIFTINHYSGLVVYNIEGFISKNNDSLQDDLNELIAITTNDFLLSVWTCNESIGISIPNDPITPRTRSRRSLSVTNSSPRPTSISRSGNTSRASNTTISLSIRQQLDQLINSLNQSYSSYIKCIKPNTSLDPELYQTSYMLTQLRYADIINVLNIQSNRFIKHDKYKEFYKRYEILYYHGFKIMNQKQSLLLNDKEIRLENRLRPNKADEAISKKYCHVILDAFLPSNYYQYGKTMLFLNQRGWIELEKISMMILTQIITKLQKNTRRYVARKKYQRILIDYKASLTRSKIVPALSMKPIASEDSLSSTPLKESSVKSSVSIPTSPVISVDKITSLNHDDSIGKFPIQSDKSLRLMKPQPKVQTPPKPVEDIIPMKLESAVHISDLASDTESPMSSRSHSPINSSSPLNQKTSMIVKARQEEMKLRRKQLDEAEQRQQGRKLQKQPSVTSSIAAIRLQNTNNFEQESSFHKSEKVQSKIERMEASAVQKYETKSNTSFGFLNPLRK